MADDEANVTRVTSTKRGRRSSRVEMDEDEVGFGFTSIGEVLKIKIIGGGVEIVV